MSTLEELRQTFSIELQQANTTQDVETLRIKYLGKKSPLQHLMKSLKEIPAEQRPGFGKSVNDLKEEVNERLATKQEALLAKEEEARLSVEKIDITLPGRRRFTGRKHIVNHTLDDMIDILIGMGFTVQDGPDIDSDYYNFEALNFPQDHPARDMQDTFYLTQNMLLRTHTSNVQTRVMENHKPPIRIIAPGRAYRNETISARSHVFFHQVEAVYINTHVTFADLLATMDEFLQKLFRKEIETRYRPSYFPFVEPGMEVDVSCFKCSGAGCGLCKHTGWLEVAGAGMIHPEVLKNGGIDPEEFSGFAWGMGVERLTILKHGIDDIRRFTENDLRFLCQW